MDFSFPRDIIIAAMRILFLTGRETTYPRNDVLLRAFRTFADVEVAGFTENKRTALRSLQLPLAALPKLRSKQFDLVFVGFYGQLLMLTVPFLARSKVLFDAFISTYDTLTGDRQRFSPNSLPGRMAFWLDRYATRRADRVLLDTPEHAAYFQETFGVPQARLSDIPVGCSEALFYPRKVRQTPTVFFYGSYQPLHGTDIVVQAAGLLRNEPFSFKLIGEGQMLPMARNIAGRHGLENVLFEPPVPLANLPNEIAQATICLGGHFGLSEKARRVVPGKIYQMLAMQRPVIAADTQANRGFLKDRESAYLVPPGDAEALARAIREAMSNPTEREQIAAGGRDAYLAYASEARIAARLQAITMQVVGR